LCDEICPTDAIFMNKMYEVSAYEHEQILSIDLMDEGKYTHLDPNYSHANEVKRNEDNTVGKVTKAPAPAAAPAAAQPAAAPTAPPPAAPAPKPNSTQNPSTNPGT